MLLEGIGTPEFHHRLEAFAAVQREAAQQRITQMVLRAQMNQALMSIEPIAEALSRDLPKLSEATLKNYANTWKAFSRYAAERGLPALPASPELVCAFLLDCRERRSRGLNQIIAAISRVHRLKRQELGDPGFPDPTEDARVMALRRWLQATQKDKTNGGSAETKA
jgi:hypothetical protein